MEGGRARVTCEAGEGSLPLVFQWRHRGKDISPSADVRLASIDSFSSTISIPLVTEKHAGNYSCLATNAFGSDQQSALLQVNGKNVGI